MNEQGVRKNIQHRYHRHPQQSVGTSLILTIFFGPLGMLYSTILGSVVMFILCFVVAFVTFGLGLLFLWPICIIWGAVAVNRYNRKQGIAWKQALDKP